MPLDCPLHESYDLYGIQEGNKTQEYASKWRCEFCGKTFFTESYLDQHFVNKHSDMLVKVKVAWLNSMKCDNKEPDQVYIHVHTINNCTTNTVHYQQRCQLSLILRESQEINIYLTISQTLALKSRKAVSHWHLCMCMCRDFSTERRWGGAPPCFFWAPRCSNNETVSFWSLIG